MTVTVNKSQFNVRDELTSTKGLYRNAWGPCFSAVWTSGSQNFTNNTFTKVQFPTKEFDTHSCYDTSLYRFTPTVPGIYLVTSAVQLGGSATGITSYTTSIYKNGTSFKRIYKTDSNAGYALGVSATMYLNGLTDYIEMYVNIAATGGTPSVNAGADITYFQATFLRGA